jgi:hypothetical protein
MIKRVLLNFKNNVVMSHVVLPKAAKRSAYSAALPILSSDAPYELLLFRQPLNAITELLKTCDRLYYVIIYALRLIVEFF